MRGNEPILLVEDDEVDVMTLRRAVKDLNITNPLQVASDGLEALSYLRNPHNAKPCVILLDLKMPRMDGFAVLQEIKKDVDLKGLPVIVLTGSDDRADKLASFNLSAAGYVQKPVDYLQLLEAIRTIKLYWTLSEQPPPDESM